MKAITFLEWLVSQSDLNLTDLHIDGKLKTAAFFYSQPFKPELITELFEGWELIGDDKYSNGKITYSIPLNQIFTHYEEEDDSDLWLKDLVCIGTLNDFISDCDRVNKELKNQNINSSGIELTFKPEIVEKYSK